jgi:hypothetical protein
VACAVAAGAAALVVYGRTLAPGLIALLDTPMFQFVGRVLGVPHNPGYPLYVMLTYPLPEFLWARSHTESTCSHRFLPP